MSVREYIGARYVPIFGRVGETSTEWDNSAPYEPLTVVTYQGASYTSRQYVPAGIPITDEDFWVVTGNYNAQVEAYRQEVRTYDGRITANADSIDTLGDDLATETQARSDADTTLTEDLATEVQARTDADLQLQTDVIALNNRFPVITSDIADEAITIPKLSPEVLNLHASAMERWPKAYLNAQTGDDATAVINDPAKPFATMQAALNAMKVLGNNFDFVFQTGGSFSIKERFFVGSVVHFRAPTTYTEQNPSAIHISCNGPAGDFFFYDSHVNMDGQRTCPIYLDFNGRNLEQEGSTFWCKYVHFNVLYMTLIQGSAWFYFCELYGYITSWFAFIRIHGLRINNQLGAPALRISCGVVRFEVDGITILKNNNEHAGEYAAIYLESTRATLTSNMNAESIPIRYNTYLESRASIVHCADSYLTAMNSYTENDCVFTSLSARIAATVIIPSA